MMIILRTLFHSSLLSLALFSQVYAATFPHGCEVKGFSYDGRVLSLNDTGAQTFYLLQNINSQPIELRRVEEKDVFMSPPLIARLQPENWAAFASDIQNMQFECLLTSPNAEASELTSEIPNPKLKTVDCRDVLEVCQYPRVKFALSNMGNYWVSTNKPQRQVINDAAAKGILLRW